MAKYRLYFSSGASASVEVEANSEEEAIDAAYDQLPRGVCAQCSGWGKPWDLEIGEFEMDNDAGAIVEVSE